MESLGGNVVKPKTQGMEVHDALLIIALHSYVPDVIVPFVGEVLEIQTES